MEQDPVAMGGLKSGVFLPFTKCVHLIKNDIKSIVNNNVIGTTKQYDYQ